MHLSAGYHVVVLVAVASACVDEDDCGLLGKCTGGSCVCHPGWTGPSCSAADLAPLDVSMGYQNATASSWGGRPIWDQASQRWQLMVTEIKNQCPLILFEYNSMVVRAVSAGADAAGPYTHAETMLPPFHHNPTFVGPTPDGYYLMFFIGANNASGEIDCRSGIPDVDEHPSPQSNGYITMAWTKDIVNGPWEQRVILRDNNGTDAKRAAAGWHCGENNPSAVITKNGTVVVVYRANYCAVGTGKSAPGEQLGIAVATHFTQEFVRDPEPIVKYNGKGFPNNEDPFMFDLPDGSWHIVNHQQSTGNVCGSENKGEEGHSCGAHWFARNPHGPWKMSPGPVYSENVTLINGTRARFQTRQRPQLVFGTDGRTPLYLFTSGSFDGNNPDLNMTTHTYAQAFRQSAAPANADGAVESRQSSGNGFDESSA